MAKWPNADGLPFGKSAQQKSARTEQTARRCVEAHDSTFTGVDEGLLGSARRRALSKGTQGCHISPVKDHSPGIQTVEVSGGVT